jgi:predicted RNA-binding Zn-ribbon protein involved in translation (DUF1610 family)
LLYNLSMLVLTVVGAAGILVYSYKMSRSRVYPVGLVHKPPVRQSPPLAVAEQETAAAEARPIEALATSGSWGVGKEGSLFTEFEILASNIGRSNIVLADPTLAKLTNVNIALSSYWQCPKCGSLQRDETQAGKEMRCERCAFAVATGGGRTQVTKAAPLESQVAQHDRTLRDFEERIRKLEKDSVVQKIQEVARETAERQQGRDLVN